MAFFFLEMENFEFLKPEIREKKNAVGLGINTFLLKFEIKLKKYIKMCTHHYIIAAYQVEKFSAKFIESSD